MFITTYISEVYTGVKSLLTGMRVTGSHFLQPSHIITQQYPNNRATLKLADRFKGEVVMPHDEKNEHACTGCTSCELACPNGSIKVITKNVILGDGRKKKAIDEFVYRLDMCTMCGLCIEACPTDAIKMIPTFEHSVFDRKDLIKQLNKPDSKLREGVE